MSQKKGKIFYFGDDLLYNWLINSLLLFFGGTTFKSVSLAVNFIKLSVNQYLVKIKNLHFFGTKWDSFGTVYIKFLLDYEAIRVFSTEMGLYIQFTTFSNANAIKHNKYSIF